MHYCTSKGQQIVEQSKLQTDLSRELPALRSFIDGEFVVPAVERNNSLRDPNTREPLQAQLACSPQQVETALAASHAAYLEGSWEHSTVGERADVLDAIADALDEPLMRERIAHADAITTGAVINITRRMAQLAPFVFRGRCPIYPRG